MQLLKDALEKSCFEIQRNYWWLSFGLAIFSLQLHLEKTPPRIHWLKFLMYVRVIILLNSFEQLILGPLLWKRIGLWFFFGVMCCFSLEFNVFFNVFNVLFNVFNVLFLFIFSFTYYLCALVSDNQKFFMVLMPKRYHMMVIIEMIIMILIIMIPLTHMLIYIFS